MIFRASPERISKAAVQLSGCRECLALSLLLQEGSRDTSCVRCEQVDDLLSLVAEEEVGRLRSIRDCGKGIDWWSCTLPSLQEGCGGDAPQAVGDHLLSHSQVGSSDLRDRDGNKSLFGTTNGLPLNVSRLPRCPYITGMRLWSWTGWGMLVKVHLCRRGYPKLVSLLPVLLQHQSGKKKKGCCHKRLPSEECGPGKKQS